MERVVIDRVALEYEVSGTGEPVVFVHGSVIADAFRPLAAQRALAGSYRLITYHRRGYGGSSRTPGPISLQQQASDCQALLQQVGVQRTHVVGHSFGGAMALQLALDAPELVHSLAFSMCLALLG